MSDTGDFGRLQQAFDRLASRGVLCRMSFTCCQTCGTAEIDDERSPRPTSSEGEYPFEEWAYTFFHQQDSERLNDPGASIFLTYSAFRPAPGIEPDLLERARVGDEGARREVVDRTDTTVGELVRDALVAEGLTVDWNGTSAQRIRVHVPQWRKRLPRS